ncbi:MAG TPA: hypothetical protein VFD58_19930 [Blastocatellia bacterium]|nr:hypothetical protein [Blastocatellia bacterium]
MIHDNNQSLEEKLQRQTSTLLARRFSSIEAEIQRLQSSINEFCERLLTQAADSQVSAEEVADLSAHFKQTLNEESDLALSRAVAEAVAKAEEEFQRKFAESQAEAEAQINELRVRLAAGQQTAEFTVAPVASSHEGRFDLLRDAIADLDAQRTQAEALTTLVGHAAHFAPRVVFFVIKSGSAIGWKAIGFANGLNDDTVRSLSVPTNSVRLLSEAIDQQHTASATAETMDDSAALLGPYGAPRAERAVAIPLTVRGKVAAVLYADSGTEGNATINTEALEALLQVTSLVIELLPVRRSTEQPRPAVAEPAQPVAKQPTPVPVTPIPPTPVAPPPAPTPVFYGGLGDEQPARIETPSPSEQATPAFASVTPVVQPAPMITPPPAPPEAPVSFAPMPAGQPVEEPRPATTAAAAGSSSGTGEVSKSTNILSGNAGEAEIRAHNDARRFARLLVSEIKLYNETKVADGRRSNDLYERLKEDIDRSRQMYEKRVPPPVAAKYDYFYDELVHTLAEGDAAKLGHGCPGPTAPVS